MKEINNIVTMIVVPVSLDDASLCVAKQAAQLAREHGAVLHLLHTLELKEVNGYRLFAGILHRPQPSLSHHKDNILQTWRRSLSVLNGITVTTEIAYGKWDECLLTCAREKNADIIALHAPPEPTWWRSFVRDRTQRIIRDSPCQVVTFFSERENISEWKNVVIPVIGFVPEIRLRTIFRVARKVNIKIHLVTIDEPGERSGSGQFSFVMEAIKLLKAGGNVQVQCSSIKDGMNRNQRFISFARAISADVLMTNQKIPDDGFWGALRRSVAAMLRSAATETPMQYQPAA